LEFTEKEINKLKIKTKKSKNFKMKNSKKFKIEKIEKN